MKNKSIKFGTFNYEESFTKFIRPKSDKNFFSNLKKIKGKIMLN